MIETKTCLFDYKTSKAMTEEYYWNGAMLLPFISNLYEPFLPFIHVEIIDGAKY